MVDSVPDAMPGTGLDLIGTGLSVTFTSREHGVVRVVRALRDVDIVVTPGRVVGVVGESGSGKSTLARVLVGLQHPTAGTIRCGDIDIGAGRRRDRRLIGRRLSMVFQDPRSSLNPRLTVAAVIADPLVVHRQGSRQQRDDTVRNLLHDVGLPPSVASRPVRALSGGQLQRVAIARALSLQPAFIVADEPTSALDVSVQAQILNLLKDLHEDRGFGMLMISHDMRVMRAMTDEVIVMLDGSVVEQGPTADVFARPQSAYAQQLIAATPVLGTLPGR